MNALLSLGRRIDALAERTGSLVGYLTGLMVLIGAWNALARWSGRFTGLHLSTNALIETQWYLFSLVFLLGASVTLKRNEHVRVDVLYGRLGDKGRAWLDLVGTLALLVPFATAVIVFTWPGVLRSIHVHELSPDPGGLPRYPLKAVVPLAFGLLLLQGLSEAIKKIAIITGKASTASESAGPSDGTGPSGDGQPHGS
jgi:TRAP-type mannitol/chloroaromatic compound transport system permease small subunit